MTDPRIMLMIAGLVLLGACLVVGFLAGIACARELAAERRREERARRWAHDDHRRDDPHARSHIRH